LDIILQLPNSKTRNVSWGRITAIAYVALGYTRYSEIKKKK
jgi:hypothetical protein